MSELAAMGRATKNDSASRAWMRALELTAPIPQNPNQLMADVIERLAQQYGDAPALLSDRETLSYCALAHRANCYASWALEQGIGKGDVVGLLMPNRPEYFAIWLGISSVGGVVALLNTHLPGTSLAHCIRIVQPKHVVVAEVLIPSYESAAVGLETPPEAWIHGADDPSYRRIDTLVQSYSGKSSIKGNERDLSIHDRALYIYTSGTTGLPKAATISHGRVLQWTHWFAGMMHAQPDDRVFNCLPMYHSIGGVLVPGAALVGGASVVVSEKFSTGQFWGDVLRWDCTIFQYIGEFCRYLLRTPPSPNEHNHRIRMACGNGLAADVWSAFQDRFRIPRILEFYASTEGAVSLFNAEGKAGAIGRIPPYLAHRFSPALVRFDVDRGEPVRDQNGFCVRCSVNQPGEALGRIAGGESNVATRFEGYSDETSSSKKVLHDVFEAGDAWFHTGDLMRRDEKGYFYFVDRVGDTFRWKGENVATSEVAEALCGFAGVQHAVVYGVAVPGADGKAGMAALALESDIDFPALREYLAENLPAYARPIFLRIVPQMELTGTFKYSKTELAREAFDPCANSDAIFVYLPEQRTFVRLNQELYSRICAGQLRF